MPASGSGGPPIPTPKQLGRISGPLLKANLERKGIDLAFETDLLYLDVQGRYIGVRKLTPSHELEITNSGLRTTYIDIELPSTVNGIEFDPTTSSIISSNTDEFIIEADNINVPKLATDDLSFLNDTISSTQTNSSINITPTGRVNFGATTNVAGNVFINGNALYFSYTAAWMLMRFFTSAWTVTEDQMALPWKPSHR